MSAKALAACSFEPAAEQTVGTDPPALEGLAAEIQSREDLWREYRREAMENSKTTERTGAAGASTLARRFRWWNAGGKS